MHSMPWLVQLAQLECSEHGFLQDGRELWLGFPAQEAKRNVSSSNKIPESPEMSPEILEYLTSGFFTDEAMGSGGTRVGPEPSHLRLLQVGAETWVTGLTGQPTEATVGERRHVFPTPVRHIDFPEAHPWRQPLWNRAEALETVFEIGRCVSADLPTFYVTGKMNV